MRVPEEIRAAVAQRLRELSRAEREILMRAAAIGDRFDLSVLAAVVLEADGVVRGAIARACGLQLVVADDAPGRYRFRHALTREIVYAELQLVRVGRIHRRIARALEGSASAPVVELAYHYWAAGDAKRGCLYNEKAGDLAAAAHAGTDARRLYVRARGCVAVASRAYHRLTAKIRALDDLECVDSP